MEKKLAMKEREMKEEKLRELAQKARDERAGIRTADAGGQQGTVNLHLITFLYLVHVLDATVTRSQDLKKLVRS